MLAWLSSAHMGHELPSAASFRAWTPALLDGARKRTNSVQPRSQQAPSIAAPYPPLALTGGGGSCLVFQIILWVTNRCVGRVVRPGLNEAPTRRQTPDHPRRFSG